jgi:hypothetical protein
MHLNSSSSDVHGRGTAPLQCRRLAISGGLSASLAAFPRIQWHGGGNAVLCALGLRADTRFFNKGDGSIRLRNAVKRWPRLL